MTKNKRHSFAPAITLMIMAPLIAEVLPGATRFSSIFVFPVEMCVWGGGALLIRYVVRKKALGWLHLLLLALALSVAEEFLIQQTSLAPMVIKIKGVTYARALGINYVYLWWALIYESVFVVFLPVYLVELIFPDRRKTSWLGRGGLIAVIALFLAGSFLAWYSWTQMARPKVFHVPAYHPPGVMIVIAVGLIGGLIFIALGPLKDRLKLTLGPRSVPSAWLLAVLGGLWAVFLYGIATLAFGLAPAVPPFVPLLAGGILGAAALYWLPRWIVHPCWQKRHRFAVIFGVILGAMMAGFIGFIGAAPQDLYFKIVVDLIAIVLLIMLGLRLRKMTDPLACS